jgi:hypothetical protein
MRTWSARSDHHQLRFTTKIKPSKFYPKNLIQPHWHPKENKLLNTQHHLHPPRKKQRLNIIKSGGKEKLDFSAQDQILYI